MPREVSRISGAVVTGMAGLGPPFQLQRSILPFTAWQDFAVFFDGYRIPFKYSMMLLLDLWSFLDNKSLDTGSTIAKALGSPPPCLR